MIKSFAIKNASSIISSLIASIIFALITPFASLILEKTKYIVLFSQGDMVKIGVCGGLFIFVANICRILFPRWFMKKNLIIHKILNYLTCILFILFVLECFNAYYYASINLYTLHSVDETTSTLIKSTIQKLIQHSVILAMSIIIVQIIQLCVLNKSCGYSGSIYQNFAITSTCIPYKRNGGIITTYLVYNKSYNSNQWMFPGGHVIIENGDIPDKIAERKAEIEAGLKCEIIDVGPVTNIQKNGNDKFDVLKSAHLTYLFSLDNNVECYRTKGHKYHLDNIFIAEVKNEVTSTCNYETLELQFEENKIYDSNNNIDSKYINENIVLAINKYIKDHKKTEVEYNQYGTYVINMICDALVLIL